MYEVNLLQHFAAAMQFFFQDWPLFPNYPVLRVLETQLTFMAVEEPDYPALCPRPSRFPSGFALGKSLGSREIFRASGMDFPIPPSSWWSTDTFSHHYQGRIDFTTVNLFHSAGMDLACIFASREGLTNPLPRGKIDQSSP